MPTHNFCESDLEFAVLEWFEELGYEVVFGPDISPEGKIPERKDYSDVILEERLKAALSRINPCLPNESLDEAFRQISIPLNPGLLMNNKAFHKMITYGLDVHVKQKDGRYRTEKAYAFDHT